MDSLEFDMLRDRRCRASGPIKASKEVIIHDPRSAELEANQRAARYKYKDIAFERAFWEKKRAVHERKASITDLRGGGIRQEKVFKKGICQQFLLFFLSDIRGMSTSLAAAQHSLIIKATENTSV